MAGSSPVHKTELNEAQKQFLGRALKGDRLPVAWKRGQEIRERVNALSLERERLREEIAELQRTKQILDGYAKEVSGGIAKAASGTREDFCLRAELDVIKSNLIKVENRLNEYAEIEMRPNRLGKILGLSSLTGTTTAVASEFSATAVLIALGIAITPPVLAAVVAVGITAGAATALKSVNTLEMGAKQAKKEMAAAKAMGRIFGFKDGYVEKEIWCLRNGVPITQTNLDRDKDGLLRSLKQDTRDKKELRKTAGGKVCALWDPKTGYSAYFNPGGTIAVLCANNRLHAGFITYYGDGSHDTVQYPNVRWPMSPADKDLSRTKFEDDMKEASARLLARKAELDRKIENGEIAAD